MQGRKMTELLLHEMAGEGGTGKRNLSRNESDRTEQTMTGIVRSQRKQSVREETYLSAVLRYD